MDDEENGGPIDADKLTEPLVFCMISGGQDGWFHARVTTTAKTINEATAIGQRFLDGIFPGKRRLVREEPGARESRDYPTRIRVVAGFCRFSFHIDEDGPTEVAFRSDETEITGFSLPPIPKGKI
jgi:hypothetical protein